VSVHTLRRAALSAPVLALAFASAATVRASAGGTVLGQVGRGDRFAGDAQQGGWVRIDWRGRRAWVSASFVQRVAADLVQIDTDVNVRTGPDTGYARLGVAAKGQRYVRVTDGAGWDQLQFDSRAGWSVEWALSDAGTSSAPQPRTTTTTRSATSVTQAELEILARIVKGEAGQSSYEGKVAVAAVVLNRVRHPWFPGTIERVAHQPWQFSCYNANVRNRLYWGPIPQSCWDAAQAAVDGWDPTNGATHYFNPFLVRPSWARTLVFIKRIGSTALDAHDFYRPR
jgi:hypothetical protein